ncbi:pyridoxal phosphate biosynthetic protein [Erythrobacter sp. MTPC3]|uniref:pyridoxal phosphate biosynthetic protein n=1 Tax=Erythrobacter sp. MTPC3 TaxID=3056564 RepID=UPI0036F19925
MPPSPDNQPAPELSSSQRLWAFAAAALFLISIGFLGLSLNLGRMMPFAIGWTGFQIFGFVGALRIGKGDFTHPLFKSQVCLHALVFALVIALFLRGA